MVAILLGLFPQQTRWLLSPGKLPTATATAGPTKGNFVLEHNAQNSKEKERDKLKLYLSPMFIHWNSSHPMMLNT